MKQFKQRIVHFLLLFYLFSSYLGATHIHHDVLASHHDCKICIVVKNLHNSDIPDPATLPAIDNTYYQKISLHRSLFAYELRKGFDAHAPPLFS